MLRRLSRSFFSNSRLSLDFGREIPSNLNFDRPFHDTTLANGIRVCSESWPSPLSHVTVFIKCGSRNESEETSGCAHFLEHLHFKGTSKRHREQLELDVENLGSQLNAYTSRENTSYTINGYSQYTENAIEILGDVLTNSRYDKMDIENERNTIYRELYETRKMQFESTIEISHRGAYKNHQMALPILGKIQNMYSINREMITDYHDNNYYGSNIIIVGGGGLEHQQLCEYVTKHFAKARMQPKKQLPVVPKPQFQSQAFLMQSELTDDVNVGLFYEAPQWDHPKYYDFLILQRLLGDRPTNIMEAQIFARTNLNTFQKHQLDYQGIYQQKAVYTPYKDTGLFGNYFVATLDSIKHCTQLQQTILQQYANHISSEELQRAKRRLYIELCQHETGNDITQAIANQILYFDRRIYRQEIAKNIANLTENDIKNTVKEWLLNKPESLTLWGNVEPVLESFGYSKDQMGQH